MVSTAERGTRRRRQPATVADVPTLQTQLGSTVGGGGSDDYPAPRLQALPVLFLVVAEHPNVFATRPHTEIANSIHGKPGCRDWPWTPMHVQYLECREAVDIYRLLDGTGYILNVSPKLLQVTYSTPNHDESFGPTHDYIPPMQAKEIGAAPLKVQWTVVPL